jgi:hypothetical protein
VKVARILVWSALAVLVIAAIAVALLPRMLGSDAARGELERVLGDALGRPVTIGTLEVEGDAPRVELGEVIVHEIDPFVGLGAPGPLAKVGRLRVEIGMEALLSRNVVGSVRGEGLELHVVKKDGRINLAGIGRGAKPRPDAPPLDVHLDVELSGARVLIEDLDRGESIELSNVGVRALLSNRDSDRDARLTVTVAELDLHGVIATDVQLQGVVGEDAWVVSRLTARIGETGRLDGSAKITPKHAEGPSFRAEAELSGVAIDGPAADAVAALFPVLAAARGEGPTAVRGRVGATLSLSGAGLSWATIAPSLAGEGELRMDDVYVPAEALAMQLAELAGRPEGSWTLPHGSARFQIADGWVLLREVRTEEGGFDAKVRGRVSLKGKLDVTVDLMPLVRAFGGGLYAEAARLTTSIPVRIGGTVHAPKLEPPSPAEVARGLAGGLLRRVLTGPPEKEGAVKERGDG